MKYIYAYYSPFATHGVVDVLVLDEEEVFDILYTKIGLTNRFDTLEELCEFIDEYELLADGPDAITVTTLSGELLLQT